MEFNKELIDFAEKVSKTWNDPFGINFPNGDLIGFVCEYVSENNTYQLQMYNRLLDPVTFIPLKTPARVSIDTGRMEFSILRLREIEAKKDFVYSLVLWCVAEKNFNNSLKSDVVVLEHCLSINKSKRDLSLGYVKMFEAGNNYYNFDRYRTINKYIREYKKPSIWKKIGNHLKKWISAMGL